MILVIAEKPSLGRDIAAALPGRATAKDGCIYKGDYVITWVYGHMLTFKDPEDYDEKYKAWDLAQLPIYFENWGQKIGEESSKKKQGQPSKRARVKQIGALLKQADMVIHAGDPDEEGQLLVDELLRWFNYKGPVKRLDTGNTVTPALQKALKRMRDNSDCINEGYSAYARGLADFIVGINMTRYFSVKNNNLLSVGRVQTPTLGLVVARDLAIEGHVKTSYYELYADVALPGHKIETHFNTYKENPALTDGRFLKKGYLIQKAGELRGATFHNINISKVEEKEAPPLPFNLVKLQSYCGATWGYSPAKVMAITQRLREEHHAITYNRSDCQYLSDEHFDEAPGVIASVAANLHRSASAYDPTIKSRCFNSANITAHFAIIPTITRFDISQLSEEERNVYTIIANFYLAQFMNPVVKEKTTMVIDLGGGESLTATSFAVKDKGFQALLPPKKEIEHSSLSDLPEGTYTGKVISADIKEKETTPPSHYTKSSLNEDMTRIAKYVDDPEIKRLLLLKDKDKKGENGSIGTSATRSAIIEILIQRGYLVENGRVLVSTPLGRKFYSILPDEIKKPDLTAKWWAMQEDIRSGEKDCSYLIDSVLETVKAVLGAEHERIGDLQGASVKVGRSSINAKGQRIIGPCPKCGADVVEKEKSFGCSNRSCGFALWKKDYFLARFGKKMTAALAKGFLTKRKALVKGMVGRSGRPFDAVVRVNFDGENPQYTFDFEP